MDKLAMAHDFAMKLVGNPTTPLKDMNSIISASWVYADAMQAEAEKRENKERPDALCEVDWSQAPKEYQVTGWYIFKGVAHWISDDFPCSPAPSFGFTGTHIVERPHGF